MTSLYQLTGERLALQKKLEGFDETTVLDTLEAESTALTEKIEDYGYVIRNLEAFGEMIKAEEVKLADRRKAHEAKVAHIKNWLLTNMEACGITKIECPAFSITVKTNPPKLIVDDEKVIPSHYFVVPDPTPPQLDKNAVKAALKAGEVIEGVHIEQGTRLEVK